jgi:hypothetical protein
MEGKHIDDRIPGEVERINAIRDLAWKDSRRVIYRSCEDCYKDVVIQFDVDDSDVEDSESCEDDSITNEDDTPPQEGIPTPDADVPAPEEGVIVPDEVAPAPLEGVPPQSRERFLCHSCKEEAAAKMLQCDVCVDHFKAFPSDEAYTAEKPICGQCVWANMEWYERYCSNCGDILKMHMLPYYWNEFEDDEVLLCQKCREELMGEDAESVEGTDVSGTADLIRTL